MTLRELTTRLQTLCHDGYSNHEIGVQVLDAFYKTGDVLKVSVGNSDKDERIYFVIDTEVM